MVNYLNYSNSNRKIEYYRRVKISLSRKCNTFFSLFFSKIPTSLLVSLLIAQNSKPFIEDVFVKNCIIEAVKVFGNFLILEEAINIRFSARITDINDSIRDKLKSFEIL